jgi:hypothetical protein
MNNLGTREQKFRIPTRKPISIPLAPSPERKIGMVGIRTKEADEKEN